MGRPIKSDIELSQKNRCYNDELVQAFIDYAYLIDSYDYSQRRAGKQDTSYLDDSIRIAQSMSNLTRYLQKYAGIDVKIEYDPKGHYGQKLMSIKFDFSNWMGV